MNFSEYWKQLLENEKKDFCTKVGFSYKYVTKRLIYKSRKPSIEKIDLMVESSNGKLTHKELIHFFISKEKAPSAETPEA